MYDESLIQTLHGLLNGSNAGTTKRQFIGDLGTFILNHIPYAQVQPKDLQTGLISMDGPEAIPGKPPLVWHFGGFPYPIAKGAMVEYVYVRNWDGSGQTVHASILFGFQADNGTPTTLRIAPHQTLRTARLRRTSTDFMNDLKQTVSQLSKTVPSAIITDSRGHADLTAFVMDQIHQAAPNRFTALTSSSAPAPMNNALPPKAPASSAASGNAGPQRSAEPETEALAEPGAEHPAQPETEAPADAGAETGADAQNQEIARFNGALEVIAQRLQELAQKAGNGNHAVTPRGLQRRAMTGNVTADVPFDVEFDGPARDHDSHHIFPYTLETLFNDQELFGQILWWYFAGQAVRITKAMRIPLDSGTASPSLFVGYSGPGSHP